MRLVFARKQAFLRALSINGAFVFSVALTLAQSGARASAQDKSRAVVLHWRAPAPCMSQSSANKELSELLGSQRSADRPGTTGPGVGRRELGRALRGGIAHSHQHKAAGGLALAQN